MEELRTDRKRSTYSEIIVNNSFKYMYKFLLGKKYVKISLKITHKNQQRKFFSMVTTATKTKKQRITKKKDSQKITLHKF